MLTKKQLKMLRKLAKSCGGIPSDARDSDEKVCMLMTLAELHQFGVQFATSAAPADGPQAVDERAAIICETCGENREHVRNCNAASCLRNESMSVLVALDFADNPRPAPALCAPADTNGELYRALRVLAAAYRRAALSAAPTINDAPAERRLDEDVTRMLAALPWSDRSADADPIGKAKRVVSSMLANEAMASSTDLSCVLSVINSLSAVDAGLLADKARLDSGVIVTSERNEFGETYQCERRGNDLRAMIDEGMRLAARDRAATEGA